MGADIHTVVQRRVGDRWETQSLPDEWRDEYRDFRWEVRDYPLFGLLAGVRDPDVPQIAKQRGIPDDAYASWKGNHWDESEPSVGGRWLGEHSHSWVTVRELLDYDLTQPYRGRYGHPGGTVGDIVDLSWVHQLATLGEPDEIRLLFGFDS